MATGAALTAGGFLASAGSTGAEDKDEGETDGLEEPDGWSSFRGGPGNTGYLPIDGEFEKPDTVAWEYEEDGPLAIVDGTIYLNTGDELHALDNDDGSVEWTIHVDGMGVTTTPTVAGGTVYVGGDQLTALEADSGEVEWTFDRAVSSPTVAYGTVLATGDEALYALEPDSGEVAWERETVEVETDDESESQEHTVSSVVASDDLVHARTTIESEESDATGLAAFDPETGETAWTWLPTEHSDAPFPTFDGLMANNGRVYAVRDATGDGTGGPILDAETGERITGGRSDLIPALGEAAWIGTLEHRFTAYEPAGDELWSVDGGTMQWGPASIVGETVVVIKAGRPPTNSTELVGFDIETGDEKWTVEMEFDDRGTGRRAPILAEETVYVRAESDGDSDDGLVALRPSDEDESEETDPDEGESDDESEEDGSDEDCPYEDDEDMDCPDGGDSESGEPDGSEGENGAGDGTGDDGTDGSDDSNGVDDDTADDDGVGGTDDASDENGADDGTPGFTTGAGIVGGALGLEWLRRQTDAEEPAE